jgi:enoyl-CoA hydratase
MSDPVVLVERTDAVATVTLNRPGARNALSQELRKSLWQAMSELEADVNVAAIVLTGADPAFCAGLDLKELASTAGAALGETGATGDTASGRGPIPPMETPVIGAINGVAITGGFEVALAIMPGWGLTVLLPEAVGYRRAKELSTTGNFLDAQTALTWGLVNHVVPHDDLVPFAQQLAADIASNDEAGVRRMLQTYDEGVLVDGREAWAIEGRVAGEWQAGGRDGADLEARRKAVTERGRSQV